MHNVIVHLRNSNVLYHRTYRRKKTTTTKRKKQQNKQIDILTKLVLYHRAMLISTFKKLCILETRLLVHQEFHFIVVIVPLMFFVD